MSTEPYQLSIVVETANENPTSTIRLPASLAALARQTVPIARCEVLVVLGKGAPGLAEVVRHTLPHARILRPDQDLGYGQMKMYGARAATCEIVAFTDADSTVCPDWVAAVLDGFREAPDTVAALQGQTRYAESPGWQGATLHYCRAMWSPARRGRYLVLNNFAMRRAMIERFPFADRPARTNVERLMVTRMLAAGYRIRVEPRMCAIHAYRGGLGAWFHRGRAEAFDRLETVRSVYPLMESPARVAELTRLDRRLRHHTRRLSDTLQDLVRCRRDLGAGPAALLTSALAALTIWAGACVGAWQATRRKSRPPTDF